MFLPKDVWDYLVIANTIHSWHFSGMIIWVFLIYKCQQCNTRKERVSKADFYQTRLLQKFLQRETDAQSNGCPPVEKLWGVVLFAILCRFGYFTHAIWWWSWPFLTLRLNGVKRKQRQGLSFDLDELDPSAPAQSPLAILYLLCCFGKGEGLQISVVCFSRARAGLLSAREFVLFDRNCSLVVSED